MPRRAVAQSTKTLEDAIPPSLGSTATPALEREYTTKALTEIDVDTYDIETRKKEVCCLTVECAYLIMRSPHYDLLTKFDRGIQAMGQWQGTKKVIEWDTRKPDDKKLLSRLEYTGTKLLEIHARMNSQERTAVQLKVAEAILAEASTPTPPPAATPQKEEPTNGNTRSVEATSGKPEERGGRGAGE